MSSRTVGALPVPATTTPGAYPKRWAAAIAMIVAALMDMIDGSIVNTALPSIGRGLHADSAQLQWTVSAYTLGFAAALIIAGRLGDRCGRKNLFLGGTVLFALAGLAGATAAGPGILIGARAVQGVAAAVLMPQVLASFRTTFDERERGQVFAVYGAMAGLAVSAGILLGGLLTDWNLFGWSRRTARGDPRVGGRVFGGGVAQDVPGRRQQPRGLVEEVPVRRTGVERRTEPQRVRDQGGDRAQLTPPGSLAPLCV